MDIEIRRRFNSLIDAQLRARDNERAAKSAELAVAQGYWDSPHQRPLHFVPGLPAEPIHDGSKFGVVRYLEGCFQEIRDEVVESMRRNTSPFTPVEEPLTSAGSWRLAEFFEGGLRLEGTCRAFPRTAALLDQLPEDARNAGVVMFSWLAPGTHIVPHCGFTNARLRVHLPLLTSNDARIRIANKTLTWTEGKCLVFDDSFEHEVWHDGDTPRLVLLLDTLHPALSAIDRTALLENAGRSRTERARSVMQHAGLQRVRVEDAGTLEVRIRGEMECRIRRHMDASGLRAMWFDDADVLHLEPRGNHERC